MRTSTWMIATLVAINIGLSLWLISKITQGPTPQPMTQVSTEAVDTDNNAVESDIHKDNVIATENNPFGNVVAIINGEEVRQIELLPYLNEVVPAEQLNQIASIDNIPQSFIVAAVESYAVDLLFENKAKSDSITDNARLRAVINHNKRRSIRTAYLNSIAPTLVDDKQVQSKYDELVASLKGKKEYHARHILLATKKEADIVSQALTEKERSFDELAKLFSLDESTGFKGGDLGYQVEGKLNPEFEDAIKKLKLKNYSQPFKTELGWHIAVVEDRRDAKAIPYEQAAKKIRSNLQQQAIKSYAVQLVEKADITFIE